jgi:hypothetical protein
MLEVADVFRRYGATYLQKFGSQMLPSHRRAFYDIFHCRTAVMGGQLYRCDHCGHQQYAYHSCKNRSCPKCQTDETDNWLEQRRQELLAVPPLSFGLHFTEGTARDPPPTSEEDVWRLTEGRSSLLDEARCRPTLRGWTPGHHGRATHVDKNLGLSSSRTSTRTGWWRDRRWLLGAGS